MKFFVAIVCFLLAGVSVFANGYGVGGVVRQRLLAPGCGAAAGLAYQAPLAVATDVCPASAVGLGYQTGAVGVARIGYGVGAGFYGAGVGVARIGYGVGAVAIRAPFFRANFFRGPVVRQRTVVRGRY